MARRPQRKAKRLSAAPVELTVTEIGARGDGLADYGGQRVYVPLTVPGDRVRVHLEEQRGDGIAARLLDLLEPGPDRTRPPCPHFGVCGGCTLQHLADSAYGDWKRAQVVTALARAGLTGIDVAPAVRTPPGSRRRATFAAIRRGGRLALGFNERQSHRIADISGCLVVESAILSLLGPLEDLLAAILPDGSASDVTVTVLEGGLDVLLTGGPELGLDARERLAVFAEACDIARLSWRSTPSSPAEPVAARRPVRACFGGVAVPIESGAFLQASAAGEAALVDAVLAGVGGSERIADLFAGFGTFTFPLARNAAVHAVESDASAFTALSSAVRSLPNVTTARRDLFEDPLIVSELSRFDAVVFDPPRAGAREQSTRIAASCVPTVVAVSCNPATFARDARILTDGGYRLERVTPVDQFVWSAHVELVAHFSADR